SSQLSVFFPITVYVVFFVGLSFTLARVVPDSPLSPFTSLFRSAVLPVALAVSVVLKPWQIVAGATVITGGLFTVTVTVVVSAQPSVFFPITVYVDVAVALAVTLAHVVEDKPVAGLH